MGRERASERFSHHVKAVTVADCCDTKRDTMIRYLLDELHAYETDHSDALCPIQREANVSLLGEHSLVKPATTEDVRILQANINTDLQQAVRQITNIVVATSKSGGTCPATVSLPLNLLALNSDMNSPLSPTPMITQGAERGAAPLASLSVQCLPSPTWSDSCLPSTISQLVTNQGSLRLPASGLQHSWRSRKVSRALPTEGLVIPDIPVLNEDGTRQHRRDSWREVVKQWIEGDPKRGLVVPLKDWPPEWYQGANKSLFAMKRHDRGLVAQEFINQ
jgi:hypothetical protein